VYKGFSSVLVLQKVASERLGFPLCDFASAWFLHATEGGFAQAEEGHQKMTKPMTGDDWKEFFQLISEDVSDAKIWTCALDQENLKVWKRPVRRAKQAAFFSRVPKMVISRP
jgi:hypothetical protein